MKQVNRLLPPTARCCSKPPTVSRTKRAMVWSNGMPKETGSAFAAGLLADWRTHPSSDSHISFQKHFLAMQKAMKNAARTTSISIRPASGNRCTSRLMEDITTWESPGFHMRSVW